VVLNASKIAESGDTILLTPACASMDQFQSYAQRGEFFVEAVRELLGDD
jgi:UDP-N-acetylmuramoylalanine--D-glutamate ligase